MLLLLTAAASMATTPSHPLDAFDVFEKVCVGGAGSFAPGQLAPARSKRLTDSQLHLIRFAFLAETAEPAEFVVKDSDIKGSRYEIGGSRDIQLITPSNDGIGDHASLCAVLVPGDRFDDARKTAARVSNGDDGRMAVPPADQVSLTVPVGDHLVTAARSYDRAWTMLAAVERRESP